MSLYAFILLSTLLVINKYFTYLCPGNFIPTTKSLYNAWEQLSMNALLIFDYPVASNAVVFRLLNSTGWNKKTWLETLPHQVSFSLQHWWVSEMIVICVTLALKWKPLLLVLFTAIFPRPTTILSIQCLLNESPKIWLCVYFESKTKIFPTISKKKAINNCIFIPGNYAKRQKNNK